MICDFLLYTCLSLASISILTFAVALLDDVFLHDKK